MRVDGDRVGALPAGEVVSQLGADRRRTGVGGVDVEPDARLRAEIGERRNRIDRARTRRPDGRDERAGAVQIDGFGPHTEALVHRHLPQLELEQLRGLVRGRVRVLRAEHDPPARPQRPRDGERRQRPGRRGVLDVTVESRRQAEQLREPVERHLLELLERRRRTPEDPDLVQGGHEQLGQDPRLRSRRREVGEEPRALPVRQSGQEDAVEVVEDRGERLGRVGR